MLKIIVKNEIKKFTEFLGTELSDYITRESYDEIVKNLYKEVYGEDIDE